MFEEENIVNSGKWLRNPVNIKEAYKQAKIYVRMSTTLHIFCSMLIDYAQFAQFRRIFWLILRLKRDWCLVDSKHEGVD